jgi:hypothetical protein
MWFNWVLPASLVVLLGVILAIMIIRSKNAIGMGDITEEK